MIELLLTIMDYIKGQLTHKKIPLILMALPVIFLLILLYIKAINVPFWDEWELVPIIEHLRAGHFIFGDFWHLHNEHRLFFPTLLLIGTAIITHWDMRIEVLLNVLVAFTSFVFIYKMFIAGEKPRLGKAQYLLIFLLSLIWFSPVQTENWTWGWQVEWFLNVLGVVLATFSISRVKKSKWSNSDMVLMLTGGILAQFSLANGTLIWPIALVVLCYLGVRLKQVLTVLITGAITTALYFYHYRPPTNPPGSVIKEPVTFVKYVLIYLGRPLSFLHTLTPILGLITGASFVFLISFLFIKKKDTLVKCAPWVVLGAYALGSSLITGFGRIGFGEAEAYASRYTTMSSLLLISTIVIGWRSRDLLGKSYKKALPLCAAILLALVLVNAAWGVHSTNKQSFYLNEIQKCTHLPQPSTICLISAYPNKTIVSKRLDYLKQINWGGY